VAGTDSGTHALAPPSSAKHPDELESAWFVQQSVAVRIPSSVDVAVAAEAHNRIAGVSSNRKCLGDLVDVVDGASALKELAVVVTQDLNLVEVVTTSSTDLAALGASCTVLEHEGWTVYALVPLNRLGEAHTLCRSSGVTRLQGYWQGRETLAFGRPEVP